MSFSQGLSAQAVLAASCFGLISCSAALQDSLSVDSELVETASAVAAASSSEPPSSEAGYTVCAQVGDWQRPSETSHLQQLEALPRYGSAIHEPPLHELWSDFRSYSALSFVTYGLSARFEPIYLSGIGEAAEQMETCYSDDEPARINRQELAEVWLLGYSAVGFEGGSEGYTLTVDPQPGLQVIQFERQETNSTLPLIVMTAEGAILNTYAADW